MDKVKGLMIIIIAIISVVVVILVSNIFLDITGEVNQGNFRISDIVIESSATLTEVQDPNTTVEKLSDLVFDVSQTNNIVILIESNLDATSISIQNLNITSPILKGDMNICQLNYDKYDITEEPMSLDIKLEMEDDYYVINLCIDNDNVLRDKSVGEDIDEIQYDASIFKYLDIDISNLQFDVTFDLYITDTTGKTVMTTITLNMPTDETIEKGMSILRQDTSQFIFTVVD